MAARKPSTKLKDLTGQRFNEWTVLKRGPNTDKGQAQWICQCDCPDKTIKTVVGSTLRNGMSKGCGCNRIEAGHKRVIDITGQKFGSLTVISPTGKSTKDGKALWNCICDYGRKHVVTGKELRTGGTKGCTCRKREIMSNLNRTHGQSKIREYKAWKAAKGRVCNPKDHAYQWYGARGVTMAPEWIDDFEAFYKYIGPRPPGTSLDRFPDNAGPYAPGNVRWATQKQQNNNRRKRRWYKKPQVV